MASEELNKILPTETVINGPHSFFEGSFTVTFLKPDPIRNASVLIKATYSHGHHLTQKGKEYIAAPPFHLHFSQSETFTILQGQMGTTLGYEYEDKIWTPENTKTPHEIKPYTPHRFWPIPDATEDATMLVWAHPKMNEEGDFPPALDQWFFLTLFKYMNDVHEGKASLDIGQIMLMQ